MRRMSLFPSKVFRFEGNQTDSNTTGGVQTVRIIDLFHENRIYFVNQSRDSWFVLFGAHIRGIRLLAK